MWREINDIGITGKPADVEYNTLVKFPYSEEWYTEDVAPIMEEAIRRHGKEEWRACVLTNEMHGHLGIYSIIGVKMGMLALELLDTERDTLKVISYTGSTPPFSCLNDGIQVSTGATTGHGTIKVINDTRPMVRAVFSLRDCELIIQLKEEYLQKAEETIRNGRTFLPVSEEMYWKMVRQNGLEFWLEWDRYKIFEYKKAILPDRS
jgi:pyrimidine-specific ribonucleoside hydrolase